MEKLSRLQEQFLTRMRCERQCVTVYRINGFQMEGRILDFDENIVIVKFKGKQQMLYKHAISTIVPETPVLPEEEELS